MLGIPGVRIQLPEIDLSVSNEIVYNLDGIPPTQRTTDPYYIGVLVPEQSIQGAVREVEFGVRIWSDEGTMIERPLTPLERARATRIGDGPPTSYFPDQLIINADHRTGIRCSVQTRCSSCRQGPLKAHVVLWFGGYK